MKNTFISASLRMVLFVTLVSCSTEEDSLRNHDELEEYSAEGTSDTKSEKSAKNAFIEHQIDNDDLENMRSPSYSNIQTEAAAVIDIGGSLPPSFDSEYFESNIQIQSADDPKPDTYIENESSLSLVPKEIGKMRLLDALALTKVFRRIFPKDTNAVDFCVHEIVNCPDNLFKTIESQMTKTMNLVSSQNDFFPGTTVDLGYLRSIRAVLGRECSNLVNSDFSKLQSDQFDDTTAFVKRTGKPTHGDLLSFAKKLYGVSEEIAISPSFFGIDEIIQVFEGLTEDQMKDGYIATCIVIGSDPALIAY